MFLSYKSRMNMHTLAQKKKKEEKKEEIWLFAAPTRFHENLEFCAKKKLNVN